MNSNRGTALISVLWVVLILSVVSLTLAASVRGEIASEIDSFDSERAFVMAKGAAESIFALYTKDPELPKDLPLTSAPNGDYVFTFDTGDVHVHFESAAGLIDLNEASDKVLAALFDSVGVSQEQRNHLVDSILDWRDADDIPHLYGAEVGDYPQSSSRRLPRNGPFESVDELLDVKNMTPEVFNGTVSVNSVTGQFRRLPGIRDLVTVDSHSDKIAVNEASQEVLQAIPQMTPELAERVVAERAKKPFNSMDDLTGRVSEMQGSTALQYLTSETPPPAALISRATVRRSGLSRTVRLLFKREERVQTISRQPFLYRLVTDIKFRNWQF